MCNDFTYKGKKETNRDKYFEQADILKSYEVKKNAKIWKKVLQFNVPLIAIAFSWFIYKKIINPIRTPFILQSVIQKN